MIYELYVYEMSQRRWNILETYLKKSFMQLNSAYLQAAFWIPELRPQEE